MRTVVIYLRSPIFIRKLRIDGTLLLVLAILIVDFLLHVTVRAGLRCALSPLWRNKGIGHLALWQVAVLPHLVLQGTSVGALILLVACLGLWNWLGLDATVAMVIRILPEWFILRLWNLLTPSLVVYQLIFIRRFLESAQAYELGNVYLWVVSSRSDVIDFAHGSVTSILFRGMNFDLSLPPVVILPPDRGDLLISIFDLRILLLLKMRATPL